MEKEILDENLDQLENTKLKANLVNWISIVILWIGIGLCVQRGLIGDLQIVAGTVLLMVATFLTHFNYKMGVLVTLGILVLGILTLVEFFPFSLTIGFGFGAFDLLNLAIALVHIFTNWEVFSKIVNKESTPEEVQVSTRNRVEGFKRRFQNKSTNELEGIVQNEKLLPYAIQAAQELIDERNSASKS